MPSAAQARPRQVVLTADDFGLSVAVNEAVERAHTEGILGAASLMVGGAAAEDAVARARRLPELRVGLHLVLVEGPAVLPREEIPDLVDERGWFPSDQFRLGLRYFFSQSVRRQLAREIHAQFARFAATGLTLEHADAHKHMQLHPTVGRLMIAIGRQFGLAAVRVPSEPPRALAAAGGDVSLAARAVAYWSERFRRQVREAGMAAPDSVFGIAWSGRMTAERVKMLAPHLPPGLTELYFHPAARRDAVLAELMPRYQPEAELAALIDPMVALALISVAAILPGYGGSTSTAGGAWPVSGSPGGPCSTSPGGPCSTSPGGGGAREAGGLTGTGTRI